MPKHTTQHSPESILRRTEQLLHAEKSIAARKTLESLRPNAKASAQEFFYAGDLARRLDRFSLAKAFYHQALCKEPAHALGLLASAEVCERLNLHEEAYQQLERINTPLPPAAQAKAATLKADLLSKLQQADKAVDLLTDLFQSGSLPLTSQIEAQHTLFTAKDKLKDYRGAYAALTESKRLNSLFVGEAKITEMQQSKLLSYQRLQACYHAWDPNLLNQWKEHSCHHREIHYLIGHPRSGTTLLENILDANTGLVSSDERVSFQTQIIDPCMAKFRPQGSSEEENVQAFLQYIHSLPKTECKKLAQHYYNDLKQQLGTPLQQKIILDKNPAITDGALLALRTHPEAKFLFALRDPRSVVWSAFTLPMVGVSWVGSFWTDLNKTAEAFHHFTKVWHTLYQKLPDKQRLITRYEDTVSNTVTAGRTATEFLSLDWQDQQERFFERAGEKHVHSPTYADVAKPIYTSAIDKWRNYAEWMEPALETLQPICQELQYTD
ncbi:sulfotransferase [Rubritalea spongiae]|uniref:Sulfotransferase n=1 Tax=Rubritalea spongiae TaxID=430797 RepID=A0ABW5E4U6_9BACT